MNRPKFEIGSPFIKCMDNGKFQVVREEYVQEFGDWIPYDKLSPIFNSYGVAERFLTAMNKADNPMFLHLPSRKAFNDAQKIVLDSNTVHSAFRTDNFLIVLNPGSLVESELNKLIL